MRPYETKRKTTEVRSGTLGHKCPKCKTGYILIGGLRMGMYVDDIESCLSCGMSSESTGYTDVIKNEWVELKA